MSSPISVLKTIDPRVDWGESQTMVATEGPSAVTYQVVTPADPTVQNPNFVIQSPSQLMGLNKLMYLQAKGLYTITGTNLSATGSSNNICFRAWPLHQIMGSLRATINNTTVSIVPQLYVSALALLSNPSQDQAGVQSSTCTNPDQFTNLADVIGSPCSPMNNYTDSPQSNYVQTSRTTAITSINYAEDGTQIVVGFDIYEPLMISPFVYSSYDNSKSFFGVNNLTVEINYANTNRLMEYVLSVGDDDGVPTVASAITTFSYQGLHCSFVAPTVTSVGVIDKYFSYNYSSLSYFPSSARDSVLAPGASTQIFSNSADLPTIPNKFLIYCIQSNADLNALCKTNANIYPTITGADTYVPSPTYGTTSDLFLPLSNLSIQYGTKSAIGSGATTLQLWQQSARNGLNASYRQFIGAPVLGGANTFPLGFVLPTTPGSPINGQVAQLCGTPIIIDTASDLGIGPDICPGMNIKTQFTVSVTITNNTNLTLTGVQLYVVPIVSGLVTINSGNTSVTLGGITPADLQNANRLPYVSSSMLRKQKSMSGYSGGRFNLGDALKRAFTPHNIGTGLKMASPLLSGAFGPEAGLVASSIGNALSGSGRMSRGKMHKAIKHY